MNDARERSASAFHDPAADEVDFDCPCYDCGYNLRGLCEDGRCPECGEQIGNSLWQNDLATCDPVWLSTLLRGCGLVPGAMYTLLSAALLLSSAMVLALFSKPVSLTLAVITFPLLWIGALIAVRGVLLISRPAPHLLPQGRIDRIRLLARRSAWTLLVTCVLIPIAFVHPLALGLATLWCLAVAGVMARYEARLLHNLCRRWRWLLPMDIARRIDRLAAVLATASILTAIGGGLLGYLRVVPIALGSNDPLETLALLAIAFGFPVTALALIATVVRMAKLHDEIRRRLADSRGRTGAPASHPHANGPEAEGRP